MTTTTPAEVLRQALTFYADESRYHGPNVPLEAPDKWSDEAGLTAYRLDVTRDRGVIASKALAAIDALPSAPAVNGGSPEHMLQDMDRGLSRWLSTRPDARLHAREAAAAIAAQHGAPAEDLAAWVQSALSLPDCDRLREWAAIGPVQLAAVEALAEMIRLWARGSVAWAGVDSGEPADDDDIPTLQDIAETVKQAHDESLEGNHQAARVMLRDVVQDLERLAGPAPTAPASAPSGEPLKDHEVREAVNALRDIAVQFHGAEQLRSRIQGVVLPLVERLRAATQASAPSGEPAEWSLHFSDERDFCRFASILIGAPYCSGKEATARINNRSAWGERTHGSVTTSRTTTAPAPLLGVFDQGKRLDDMTALMKERCGSAVAKGAFVDGWLEAENYHGLKGAAPLLSNGPTEAETSGTASVAGLQPVAVFINMNEGISGSRPSWLSVDDMGTKPSSTWARYALWPIGAAPQAAPVPAPCLTFLDQIDAETEARQWLTAMLPKDRSRTFWQWETFSFRPHDGRVYLIRERNKPVAAALIVRDGMNHTQLLKWTAAPAPPAAAAPEPVAVEFLAEKMADAEHLPEASAWRYMAESERESWRIAARVAIKECAARPAPAVAATVRGLTP